MELIELKFIFDRRKLYSFDHNGKTVKIPSTSRQPRLRDYTQLSAPVLALVQPADDAVQ